jgi:hypothetical protein
MTPFSTSMPISKRGPWLLIANYICWIVCLTFYTASSSVLSSNVYSRYRDSFYLGFFFAVPASVVVSITHYYLLGKPRGDTKILWFGLFAGICSLCAAIGLWHNCGILAIFKACDDLFTKGYIIIDYIHLLLRIILEEFCKLLAIIVFLNKMPYRVRLFAAIASGCVFASYENARQALIFESVKIPRIVIVQEQMEPVPLDNDPNVIEGFAGPEGIEPSIFPMPALDDNDDNRDDDADSLVPIADPVEETADSPNEVQSHLNDSLAAEDSPSVPLFYLNLESNGRDDFSKSEVPRGSRPNYVVASFRAVLGVVVHASLSAIAVSDYFWTASILHFLFSVYLLAPLVPPYYVRVDFDGYNAPRDLLKTSLMCCLILVTAFVAVTRAFSKIKDHDNVISFDEKKENDFENDLFRSTIMGIENFNFNL